MYSNYVLGHVPENELRRLLKEAFRVIRPGGYTAHIIDLGDQFASDPAISSINFLLFSSEEFSKYNTKFCYQNRLRAPAYRQMLEEHGFEIGMWRAHVNENALQRLPHLTLHSDFADVPAEILCTTRILVLARRPEKGDLDLESRVVI